jgi:hypothetical protein
VLGESEYGEEEGFNTFFEGKTKSFVEASENGILFWTLRDFNIVT